MLKQFASHAHHRPEAEGKKYVPTFQNVETICEMLEKNS
jgi:hypothetical protein